VGVLRHNRRAVLLIAAGLAVALAAVVLMVRGQDDPRTGADSAIGASTAPTTASTTAPTTGSVPLPRAKAAPKADRKKAPPGAGRAAEGSSTVPPAGAGGAVSGFGGLTGSGFSATAPRHRVTLSVTADQPVATAVGWWIPTTPGARKGSAKYVGASWSHSAVVYGEPDYARLLVIAGIEGLPITCTISVDGKVVDRRTTQHAYGKAMCQG
jgi:hypothetical protein